MEGFLSKLEELYMSRVVKDASGKAFSVLGL